MTNEEAKRRGEHAAQLLRDPLLVEALEAIEKDILLEWENCPARDVQGREEIWKFFKTAKKFQLILSGMVEAGKLASFREKQSITDKAVQLFGGQKHG